MEEALAFLERKGTRKNREGMARYGIVAKKVFGVSVATTRGLAKKLGTDHALAAALWESGWLEARFLAAFVDDPAQVTSAQMDAWCRDFESWADCDTVSFHLFDKTPHAFRKVAAWAKKEPELVKRAAFALLASLALHDEAAEDEAFLALLPLIENAAPDGRNFVKKGVSWALRGIGHRSLALHQAATALARQLAASPEPAARWVGKDALKDLTRPAVLKRVASRSSTMPRRAKRGRKATA